MIDALSTSMLSQYCMYFAHLVSSTLSENIVSVRSESPVTVSTTARTTPSIKPRLVRSSASLACASCFSSGLAAASTMFWRMVTGTSGPGTALAPHDFMLGGKWWGGGLYSTFSLGPWNCPTGNCPMLRSPN